MSSSLKNIECPYCGFLGAEDYEESNGERGVSCGMCGYLENLSEIDQDYFDSEEEWEDYHSSLGEDNNIPTKDEINNVQSAVRFGNFLYEIGDAIHDALEFDIFVDDKAYSIRKGKPFNKVFNSFLKMNNLDKKAIRVVFENY